MRVCVFVPVFVRVCVCVSVWVNYKIQASKDIIQLVHFVFQKPSTIFIMLICDYMEKFHADTAQKMKFSIKNLFSKCYQIRRKLKKSLKENFIFAQCD